MKESVKLTRVQTAKRLGGITTAMVSQLEKQGRLPSHRQDGRAYYYETDVAKLAETYRPDPRAKRRGNSGRTTSVNKQRGALAAKVFACFKSGIDNVGEVCIATEADPAFVEALWQKHCVSLPDMARAKEAKEAAREAKRAERSREHRSFQERLARIRAGEKVAS